MFYGYGKKNINLYKYIIIQYNDRNEGYVHDDDDDNDDSNNINNNNILYIIM